MHPVDSSTAVLPSVYRTWFIILVLSAYQSVLDKTKGRTAEVQPEKEFETDDGYDSSATGSEQPGSGTVTPRESTNGGIRKPAVKAGGKRRKAVRKR